MSENKIVDKIVERMNEYHLQTVVLSARVEELCEQVESLKTENEKLTIKQATEVLD